MKWDNLNDGESLESKSKMKKRKKLKSANRTTENNF